MTPKEKAKEIIEKYKTKVSGHSAIKQCALIAVDELIESHLVLTTTHDLKPSIRCKRYWQEVKEEIDNL